MRKVATLSKRGRSPQARPSDGHNSIPYLAGLRFSWTLGAPDAGPIARGTDFGLVAADGRLKSVTGFLDQPKA